MAKNWKSHPLEDGCPPKWASAWGQDRYGVWVEFSLGEVSQKLRWIPPGKFLMGSPDSDKEAYDDEKPQHEVAITKGYWLFDTPCCQDLWEAVLGAAANASRFRGPRKPVENVAWNEAVAFMGKLNELLPGIGLRLPREAEWEYACRAGMTEPRYGELDAVAWYSKNSGKTTHDVRQKMVNPWGMYDMMGNVWERCNDSGRSYTSEVMRDPDGGSGAERVIRGGGWGVGAQYARAAYRDWIPPGHRNDNLGFRCLSSGIEAGPDSAEPVRSGASESGERKKLKLSR